MKITKRQLRKIIKEEKAKLLEQPKPHLDAAASMADFIAPMIADAWWEDMASGPVVPEPPDYRAWTDELEVAREHLLDAIIRTDALRTVTDLISSVEESLRNGEFAE